MSSPPRALVAGFSVQASGASYVRGVRPFALLV